MTISNFFMLFPPLDIISYFVPQSLVCFLGHKKRRLQMSSYLIESRLCLELVFYYIPKIRKVNRKFIKILFLEKPYKINKNFQKSSDNLSKQLFKFTYSGVKDF